MKSTLFVIALSCFLVSCATRENIVTTTTNSITTPTVQITGYAPSNVGDKEITIRRSGSQEIVARAYFASNNETPPISRSGAKYTKTGNNTAKMETWGRNGDGNMYKLQFTSPQGGKIVGKNMIFDIE